MSYKADFARFAGLTASPGLPPTEEGAKADAYDEGRSAGAAVVQVLTKGWAKAPKDGKKSSWMKIVDEYAGVQEFSKDPEWTRGFRSELVGYYGKPVTIESVEETDLIDEGTISDKTALDALDDVMGFVDTPELIKGRKRLEQLLIERKRLNERVAFVVDDLFDDLDALFDDNFDPDTGVAIDKARKALKAL